MTSRVGIVSVLALALALALGAGSLVGESKQSFAAEWSGPQKTIEVHGETITVTTREFEYGQSPSATPTSVRVTRKKAKITLEQSAALRALFDRVGFWKLKASYGAPERERNYPYTIKARTGHRSKTVTYRSNPTYDPPPEAFRQLETQFAALANGIKDWTEER